MLEILTYILFGAIAGVAHRFGSPTTCLAVMWFVSLLVTIDLWHMCRGDRVVLNSRLCKLLAPKAYAITLGRIVYVAGPSAWPALLAHEDGHRQLQWRRYGFWPFAIMYLIELARHGYHASKYEDEACEFASRADLSKYPGLMTPTGTPRE